MRQRTLSVNVEKASQDERFLVRSPAVGIYSHHPEPGSILTGGSRVGRLAILNRQYELVLPPHVGGRVEKVAVDDKVTPVEYGQVLFHLARRGWGIPEEERRETEVAREDAVGETYAVVSPTDGVFYRRPRPDAPPYVDVGDRVVQGQTLGLVEVMKCFNPIQYGGPELPGEAEIVEICVDDGVEIKAGQPLFRVREGSSRRG